MDGKEINLPESYKYIAAFLTMRCNLNCSFCINAYDKSQEFNRIRFREISGEDWVKIINKIKPKENVPVTLSGGEPFLHKDFIYIINNIKPELKIDIMTNLQWSDYGIQRFINEVKPEKISRDSKYPSIRVSYHPEQMQDADKLVSNAKKLKDAGFSIGIYSVLYPSPEQLQAINQMQFKCAEAGILFRLKEFLGEYNSELYGNYSKYPEAINSRQLKNCSCKTSELIIGPDGKVYRCHRDLYHEENQIGNMTRDDFQVEDIFRICNKFGECNPCDVKSKTDYKQQLGHTSVEIKDIM
ncbi:MAG: radical SAM protein [Nanoarchaeota archaeon]|nr:radical SAM protein [Nanoarchaeota archaeon]